MDKFIRKSKNEMCINFEYFYNVFIKKPNSKNNISGLTLRLMAFLLTELSFDEYRRLPPRRKISKSLDANESSIHKCLVLLEDNHFIVRSIEPELERIVRADEEKQQEYLSFYRNRIQEAKEKQGFSDFFRLNQNYEKKASSYDDFVQGISSELFEQNNKYLSTGNFYNNQMNNLDVEIIIEKFLIQLIQDKTMLSSLIQKYITDK